MWVPSRSQPGRPTEFEQTVCCPSNVVKGHVVAIFVIHHLCSSRNLAVRPSFPTALCAWSFNWSVHLTPSRWVASMNSTEILCNIFLLKVLGWSSEVYLLPKSRKVPPPFFLCRHYLLQSFQRVLDGALDRWSPQNIVTLNFFWNILGSWNLTQDSHPYLLAGHRLFPFSWRFQKRLFIVRFFVTFAYYRLVMNHFSVSLSSCQNLLAYYFLVCFTRDTMFQNHWLWQTPILISNGCLFGSLLVLVLNNMATTSTVIIRLIWALICWATFPCQKEGHNIYEKEKIKKKFLKTQKMPVRR